MMSCLKFARTLGREFRNALPGTAIRRLGTVTALTVPAPVAVPVMKGKLLLLALLGIAAVSAWADWPAFRGIAVPAGGRHAWAARRDDCIVYHTSDFGESWQQQFIPSTRKLWDVFFSDTLSGWTCADVSAIHHTTDGGLSWSRQNLGGTMYAMRMTFADDSCGWSSGSHAMALYTTDAGRNWHVYYFPDPVWPEHVVDFQDVSLTAPDTGWIVAGKPPDDRGRWYGGQGFVGRSVILPDSWLLLRQDTTNDYFGIEAFNGSEACVVGGDDRAERGAAFVTVDSGTNWQTATLPPGTPILRAVEFADRSHGWACGDSGFIVHTEDGGLNWTRQPTPMCSTLYDIEFADRYRGMASGDWCVLVTTDGGANWRRSAPIGVEEPASAPRPASPRLDIASVQTGRRLRLAVSGVSGPYVFRVWDATGRVVLACSDPDRVRLPAGVYTATLDRQGIRLSARFCVVR
ncbi:hypothetical protein FJY69_06395 [candidate division WOR-3 bacterium]|nr:hypothetical protein [candidate division WOR-3 bacterium]